ncbi:hypothetical protein FIU94_11360 [Sulfitobacter sp. THAF37]|uniref:hypothetical protein n=1 Tax=Sulfitobacter sp. THAF37 TaxID=2587855 RepID=UPI0012681776|nr:hypothetical protein [Sulfitobacter sp. THAF37]QFT59421.1 hypothetical protein FIU94_11360 [Sulfitobacter sp. THAF37]
MSKLSEYLCTERVVTRLEKADLSLDGLRLAHGCHFYIDSRRELNIQNMAAPKRANFTVRCSTLLAITGSPGAKDYDMISRGMKAHTNLQAQGGTAIFDFLKRREDRRKITFRFSDGYVRDSLRRSNDRTSKFAMIDVDTIGRLSTPKQILFYTRAVMAQGSTFPMFTLPWSAERTAPWRDVKRSWLSAAERLSKLLCQDYLLEPMVDAETDEVSRVKVKIVKKVSAWGPEKLFPRQADQSVCTVISGKARSLSKSELQERRKWTRADSP